ncbi:hypothetical protein G7000_20315 [Pseudomonas stutzeri]|jgi:hypothetical protein|nr:hypothetical protein [Stutzerimonas stutzeri]
MYIRITLLQMVYFLGAVFLALPAMVYALWHLQFLQNAVASAALASAVIWLVGGWWIFKAWEKRLQQALANRIRAVAPTAFAPKVELESPHHLEYFGADPDSGTVVIVDMKKGIARCEPIAFVQQWASEDNGRQAFMILRFNDFALPALSIRVARGALEDLKAKVHYALNYSVA